MKANRSVLFWGVLLIGAGVVALAQQLGYIQQFTDPQFWILVFAIISLAAVIEYALSGWKQWGWLFPAGVFGGLALVITLATSNWTARPWLRHYSLGYSSRSLLPISRIAHITGGR